MSPLDFDRPPTPESPLTSSLYHATSTMDDITTALANFSRVPSPEPPSTVTCCCGKENCENLISWLALKSRLGSRLILSAGKVNFFIPAYKSSWKYYVHLRSGAGIVAAAWGICASAWGIWPSTLTAVSRYLTWTWIRLRGNGIISMPPLIRSIKILRLRIPNQRPTILTMNSKPSQSRRFNWRRLVLLLLPAGYVTI